MTNINTANAQFKIMRLEKTPCSVSSVPLEYARKFNEQALQNHGQSIDRLNERGGLCPVEFYAVANGISWTESLKLPKETCIKWLEDQFSLTAENSSLKSALLEAQELNKALVSALEFYANTNNYSVSYTSSATGVENYDSLILDHDFSATNKSNYGGKKAREALKQMRGEG